MPSALARRFLTPLAFLTFAAAEGSAQAARPNDGNVVTTTRHHTKRIAGVDVFYREAGPADAPVVVLLHGFPSSSHMFRNLIPQLADRYRVIAPTIPDSATVRCRRVSATAILSRGWRISWTRCWSPSARLVMRCT